MPMKPGRVYVVAEIGINHNGDIDLCEQMIRKAAEIGCDAVKFQKRTVDVVYTPAELSKPRESPFGTTNGDLKRGLEFGYDEYFRIDRVCKALGIDWFASPWDEDSVDFLMDFNCPYHKVASASITDRSLLAKIAQSGRPVLMSTGMADLWLIRAAESVLRQNGAEIECIYHCTSTYPCPPEELDLQAIQTLQTEFGLERIGYSGHERYVPTTVMAIALGAVSVERHFTLDRTMWGSDQAASLEPHGMEQVVNAARLWEKARGDGRVRFHDSESVVAQKLRRRDDFSAHRPMNTILGETR